MAYFPWPEYLTVDSSVHLGPATSNCSSLSSQGSSVFPLKHPISYTWEFQCCEYSVVEYLWWSHSEDLIFQSQNITQLKVWDSSFAVGTSKIRLIHVCIKVYPPPNSSTLMLDMTKRKSDQMTKILYHWSVKAQSEVHLPWKQPHPDFSWALSTMWRLILASSKTMSIPSQRFKNYFECLTLSMWTILRNNKKRDSNDVSLND